MSQIKSFKAAFPLMDRAVRFEWRLVESAEGNYVVPGSIERKGRMVTWRSDDPHPERMGYESLLWSFAELVGYYGSDQRRKAKLSQDDGRPIVCPMSY
jgi:hypothetical protein